MESVLCAPVQFRSTVELQDLVRFSCLLLREGRDLSPFHWDTFASARDQNQSQCLRGFFFCPSRSGLVLAERTTEAPPLTPRSSGDSKFARQRQAWLFFSVTAASALCLSKPLDAWVGTGLRPEPKKLGSHVGCFCKLGVFFVGVLVMRALLLGGPD